MKNLMSAFGAKRGVAVCSTVLSLALLGAMPSHARNEIVFKSLDDLDKCAREYRYDTGVCLEPLQAYAKKNPKELFAIGKRARLQFTHWVALQFFEPALGKSPTPAQCGDEDLALAVVSGLALPPDRKDKATADRVFAGSCYSALRPAVEKAVAEAKGEGYTGQHGCAALAAKSVKPAACEPKVVVAEPPAPPEKLPSVNLATAKIGLIKVYRGPEGERVTMADLPEAKGAFAIRVDGVRSDINGKTMVHMETPNGRLTEYWTEIGGKRWSTVITHGESYKEYKVYVPGLTAAVPVSYSESDTKAASEASLRK